MAQTAKVSALLDVVGQKATLAWGVAGGTGTTTTVPVPQLRTILHVMAVSDESATGVFVGTITNSTAGSSFLATHASGDSFAWIAIGLAKV